MSRALQQSMLARRIIDDLHAHYDGDDSPEAEQALIATVSEIHMTGTVTDKSRENMRGFVQRLLNERIKLGRPI